MEWNNLYITHKVILASLARTHKRKNWQENEIMEWCQECLNNVIVDVETMTKYVEIGLEVPTTGTQKNMVYLPCNIFRLLDVYDGSDNRIDYSYNGSYIILPSDNTLTAIYINYIGTPIDENGIPLIPKTQQIACETYCKVKGFEEDVAYGNFNAQLWMMWKNELTPMISAGKNDYRFRDRHAIDKLNIIHGNLTPVIANIKLVHKEFE